ncbi:MAG: methyltransferase domain-containing protein [Myxococcales bacterium]|nr:methyltransferase domain-containing protein [Myxococcales bacterium]
MIQTFEWEAHYRAGDTPWDLGEAHPELVERLARGELRPPKRGAWALVPGCGRGHDAHWLARAGWRVTAVDVAPSVADRLRALLGPLGGEVRIADVLRYRSTRKFDLVWDHTLFCALAPADRRAYGAMVRRALAPRGIFASLVFPADRPRAEGGPPWGMSAGDLSAALGRDFSLIENTPVRRPGHKRPWAERWAAFRRR